MALTSFLVSTLLMGALAVVLGVAVVWGRNWRQGRTAPSDDELWLFRAGERASELARTPLAWGLGFAGLVLVFGGGTWLFLSGGVGAWALLAMGIAAGVVVAGYMFYGAYTSIRSRGLGSAAGVAAGSWAAGMLFLVVLVAKLLVA